MFGQARLCSHLLPLISHHGHDHGRFGLCYDKRLLKQCLNRLTNKKWCKNHCNQGYFSPTFFRSRIGSWVGSEIQIGGLAFEKPSDFIPMTIDWNVFGSTIITFKPGSGSRDLIHTSKTIFPDIYLLTLANLLKSSKKIRRSFERLLYGNHES